MVDSQSSSIVSRILKVFRKTDIQDAIIREMQRALPANITGLAGPVVLPEPYGRSLPERVVEILFARLTYVEGTRVLDVGYANIMRCHRVMLQGLPHTRHFTGIDIAEPSYDARRLYEHMVRADITHTPFEPSSFDLIWCISSLEHFGMDNSGYTENFTTDDTMDLLAVREMLRILVPGGRLLISVPYGSFEDHGTHKNYDHEHWQPLLTLGSTMAEVREWYFRHTFDRGWHEVRSEELRHIGYFDQANAGAGGLAITMMTKH